MRSELLSRYKINTSLFLFQDPEIFGFSEVNLALILLIRLSKVHLMRLHVFLFF